MIPRKPERGAPAPGSESFVVSDLGEPPYLTPVGPVKAVVRLVPADEGVATDAGKPLSANPPDALIPASEEVAKLPRLAREAFAARCAARVAPLRPAMSPEAVATLLLWPKNLTPAWAKEKPAPESAGTS